MTMHRTGTREEWLAGRIQLFGAEKGLPRRREELALQRQELPSVRLNKEYVFETDEGSGHLADPLPRTFALLVYHFMFGPRLHSWLSGMLGDCGWLRRVRDPPR